MEGDSAAPMEQTINVFGKWRKLTHGFVLTAGALVLGIIILGISFLVACDSIGAQEEVMEVTPTVMEQQQAVVMEETATAEAKIEVADYYLPYPGVLPDNPLYKLKAIRDRVGLWLEWDEEKKAEMELLFADKRINAAQFLADGGKLDLAITTATKAEKYLEQAGQRVIKLNSNGKDVKSLMGKMIGASGKHVEILESLRDRSSGEDVKTLELRLAVTNLLTERLGQILLEVK